MRIQPDTAGSSSMLAPINGGRISDEGTDTEEPPLHDDATSWYRSCLCCDHVRSHRSKRRRHHDELLLPLAAPLSTMIQKDMGMVSSLSLPQKMMLVTSNVAYWIAAGAVYVGAPIATPLVSCMFSTCAHAAFHGAQVTLMAAVSTYWHGAQVQLQIPCCRWLYCYDEDTGASFAHTPPCQRKLVLADIGCASLTIGIGILCFGPYRTLSWLFVPILTFIAGAISKRRRDYQAYAYYHSLWHVLSAIAICGIVLDGDVAFAHWVDAIWGPAAMSESSAPDASR